MCIGRAKNVFCGLQCKLKAYVVFCSLFAPCSSLPLLSLAYCTRLYLTCLFSTHMCATVAQIGFKDGEVVDAEDLQRVLLNLPLSDYYDLASDPSVQQPADGPLAKAPPKSHGSAAWRKLGIMYSNPVLVNLMHRYGKTGNSEQKEGAEANQQGKDESEGGQDGKMATEGSPEHSKDVLGLIAKELGSGGSDQGRLSLKLRIGHARGVERFFFFGGADLFCAAFVGRSDDTDRMRPLPGLKLFQTATRRGRSELEWAWNEVCPSCCRLAAYVSGSANLIVIRVLVAIAKGWRAFRKPLSTI